MATSNEFYDGTGKNIEAWKKRLGAATNIPDEEVFVEGTHNATPPVIKTEASSLSDQNPETYTITAKRAFRESYEIKYTFEESDYVAVEKAVFEHIKNRVQEGEFYSNISTYSIAPGIRKKLIQKLTHNGFKISYDEADENHLIVSWAATTNYKKILLVGGCILAFALYTMGVITVTRHYTPTHAVEK
jgi:hypothetical protein